MASDPSTTPPKSTPPGTTEEVLRQARRARLAVALLFLTNGALFANMLPRYPLIKSSLNLTNAEFGFAVACFPLGALISGLAAATLIRRFRSSRMAVVGTIFTSAGVLLAGVSPGLALLAVALFVAGSFDAITDVAQNSHGLRVQRLYGRSILNSFHAVWSMGAALGGLMGGAAAGFDVPLGVHLGISGLIFSGVALGSYRLLLPGPEPKVVTDSALSASSGPSVASVVARPRMGTYLVLLALVLIAAGGGLVEDAGSTWSAVYLTGSLGAAASVAGLGFVALVGAQTCGRLVGDRLVDRFGQRAVARSGGALTAIGMGTALLFPSVIGTIAGFAIAGLGVATLVPAAMHTADELPGLKAGTGLTLVSWLMRIGFLLSPPIVGLVADASSLRVGLIVVPLAGLLVVLLAGVLPRRDHARLTR